MRDESDARYWAQKENIWLLVCETVDDLNIETDSLYTAPRCINCGDIEDAVVRTNRFYSAEITRAIPYRRRRVRKEAVVQQD